MQNPNYFSKTVCFNIIYYLNYNGRLCIYSNDCFIFICNHLCYRFKVHVRVVMWIYHTLKILMFIVQSLNTNIFWEIEFSLSCPNNILNNNQIFIPTLVFDIASVIYSYLFNQFDWMFVILMSIFLCYCVCKDNYLSLFQLTSL